MRNQFSTDTNLAYLKQAILGANPDECLIWPFAKTPMVGNAGGYGHVKVSRKEGGNGHMVTCHRVAFFYHYGHWPEPCGLHSCDNPPCFNPHHIKAGTRQDNTRDCVSKGRFKPGQGVRQWRAKLNPELVRRIRAEYVANSHENSLVAVAKRYGVRPYTIQLIVQRRTWKHVP